MEKQAYNKIQVFTKLLKENGFSCSLIEKKNYNYESVVIKNHQKNKLQVYFGKKGVKTVIQGNDSSIEYHEINSLLLNNSPIKNKIINKISDIYIGTDETGKGDYFGPLVIAGMYVEKETSEYLEAIGVKDSKLLNDSKIDEIAEIIKSKFPNNFRIISIEPEKYNKIYSKLKNLNKLLNWGHSLVIEDLLQKISCKMVITDQFSKADLEIMNNPKYSETKFIQFPKAEKYIGVAAASILARNEMNNWFKKSSTDGIQLLKGASFEVENLARHIYKTAGSDVFNNLVKLHFKTTDKIIN